MARDTTSIHLNGYDRKARRTPKPRTLVGLVGLAGVAGWATGDALRKSNHVSKMVFTLLFITESGFETRSGWDRWDPAPKVLGAKHVSNPDVAPF